MENMAGLYPVNIRMRRKIESRVKWNNFDQLALLLTINKYLYTLRKQKRILINRYTLGAAADSFYEYLLKSWLQSGKKDEKSLSLYLQAVDGAIKKLVRTSKQSNLTYLAQIEYDRVLNTMVTIGHYTIIFTL